jgi:hypothetical protein
VRNHRRPAAQRDSAPRSSSKGRKRRPKNALNSFSFCTVVFAESGGHAGNDAEYPLGVEPDGAAIPLQAGPARVAAPKQFNHGFFLPRQVVEVVEVGMPLPLLVGKRPQRIDHRCVDVGGI